MIEVKKECACDKGERSKILGTYAAENIADQIDEQLKNLKSK